MPPSPPAPLGQLEQGPERTYRERWPWPLLPGGLSLLCWSVLAAWTGHSAGIMLLLALLGVVPGVALGWWHHRSPTPDENPPSSGFATPYVVHDAPGSRWAARYRGALAWQGLCWALCCILSWPGAEGAHGVIMLGLLALACGGLSAAGSFDPWAALMFGLPASAGLGVRASLAAQQAPPGSPSAQAAWVMVGVAAVSLPLMGLQAWRALRLLHTRMQQAERTQALVHRLTRSHQQLRIAEQLAQLGSFDWNPATGRLHWSEEHFRLWGLEPGSVSPTYEIFKAGVHPEDLAELEQRMHAALQGSGQFEFRYRVCAPNGDVRHVLGRSEVEFDAAGVAVRMVGTVQDVTARRRAEARLHAHEFVVNAIADPISVIDRNRVYRLVNDAWCRITNLPRDAVLDQPPQAVQPHVATSARDAALQRCLALGTTEVVQVEKAMPGLGSRWWEVTIYPYLERDGHHQGAVMVTRDVTERRAAQAALAESVENLRLTLNATGDAIFASGSEDPAAPLLFVNDRMLQMWNVPPERAQRMTSADVMACAGPLFINPELETARIREIIQSQTVQEDRLLLNDGRVLMRRCVPTTEAGRKVRVWGFRDITDEARAQAGLHAAEARQRALLAAFPGYIACINSEQRYTYVNDRLATLMGSSAADMVGKTVGEVTGRGQADQLSRRVSRALAGEVLSFERVQPASGNLPAVNLLITLARGLDRETGSFVCYAFGTDITPLKRTQQALEMAKEEAERANRAKSIFLSNMSHELRTPMNSVLGFAQLLQADDDPALSPRQKAQVQEILQGGRHLLLLINDLLDLARIEADQITVQHHAVPVQPMLQECAALVAPVAQRRQITVTVPDASDCPPVRADARRLRQVLLNLLGNALKYNHDGSWVRLSCAAEGQRVRWSVIDGGIGIDPKLQGRLFQRFERLGADGGPIEGAGIGLVLSRRLVEMMGGEIGVISQPGQGSHFWFTLPMAEAGDLMDDAPQPLSTQPGSLSGPGLTQPAPLDGERRQVLYIEDNPVNTLLMEAMFERMPGLQLHCVSEPAEGLRRCQAQPPDLVLADIQMPGMDGFEVLRRLRADPRTRGIPVIAVSANAMPQDQARGREAGFANYLTKPLELNQLLAAVQAALN